IGVVARAKHEQYPELIAFQFVPPTVLEQGVLSDSRDQAAHVPTHGSSGGQGLPKAALGNTLCGMPAQDMADLMAQHPGQLGLVELGKEGIGDEDLSSW